MLTSGWVIVAAVLVVLVCGQPKRPPSEYRFPVDGGDDIADAGELPSTQISNGQMSTYGANPYMCSLQRQYRGRWYFIGGAVIHNRNTVLTAAHFVARRPASVFRVNCGDFDIYTRDKFEVSKSITDINVHPGWDNNAATGYQNDLATLKVDTPFEFNDFVNEIRIARISANRRSDCVLLGWGVTETGRISAQLRNMTVSRISLATCQKTWGSRVTSDQICFLDEDGNGSACYRDGGGPAVCGDHMLGLASWGSRGCLSRFPQCLRQSVPLQKMAE